MECTVPSYFNLLLSLLPYHNGLCPWTVRQDKPLLPEVAFIRLFYHSNSKRNQDTTPDRYTPFLFLKLPFCSKIVSALLFFLFFPLLLFYFFLLFLPPLFFLILLVFPYVAQALRELSSLGWYQPLNLSASASWDLRLEMCTTRPSSQYSFNSLFSFSGSSLPPQNLASSIGDCKQDPS